VSALVVIGACLFVVPLQMQVAGLIAVAGIRPDLPGAVVYGIGLMGGPWMGGAAGLVVGLLADRFSGGLVGPQLAAKICIGAIGGLLGRRLLLADTRTHGGLSLVVFLLQGIWMTLTIWWRTGAGWRELYLTAVPEACYTAAIVMIGLWLVRRRIGEHAERLTLLIDR
jgi:LytS/YehU family sensor histidine kinase